MRPIQTLLLLITFILPPVLAGAATYQIDSDHTSAQFKVRHLMVSNVKGEFSRISGTIVIDDQDISRSKVDVKIDVAAINTGISKRDEHLRSADFFDLAKYPVMTFVGKKVKRSGDGQLKVTGDLTIRGITREVVLDVEGPTAEVKDPWGLVRRGASATTKINRKDFGLTWNKALEAGGVAVGDEVAITIEVEMVKK